MNIDNIGVHLYMDLLKQILNELSLAEQKHRKLALASTAFYKLTIF